MIKGTKEYLDDLVKNYQCTEHDNPLTVAWHEGENSYVLRCGAGHFPEEIAKNPSLTALYKQGQLPDGPIKDNIEKREHRKMTAATERAIAVTFKGIPANDLGTNELIPRDRLEALKEWAEEWGLHAELGHVALMYGKPYVTIDGLLYHAHQSHHSLDLRSRPLNEEQRKSMNLGEGDQAWQTECTVLPEQSYFIGIGIVTKQEQEEESKNKPGQKRYPVVASKPWQMAQKRAEWQALRRAFPIGGDT